MMSLTTEYPEPLTLEPAGDVAVLPPPVRPAEPVPPPSRRANWARRLALFVLLLLVLCHRIVLTRVYQGLVVQDPSGPAKWGVVVSGDDESFVAAAQLWRDRQVQAILVVERQPSRVVREGLGPSLGSLARQELVSQGLPPTAVHSLSTSAMTNWELIRALDQHLAADAPGGEVILLCPEIQSRYYRWIVRHVIPAERAGAYAVQGFASSGFHAGNWWRKRSAIVKVALAYLRLTYVVGHGEGDFVPASWSPEEYERSLSKATGSSS